jgi:hypothetical protein
MSSTVVRTSASSVSKRSRASASGSRSPADGPEPAARPGAPGRRQGEVEIVDPGDQVGAGPLPLAQRLGGVEAGQRVGPRLEDLPGRHRAAGHQDAGAHQRHDGDPAPP